MGHYILRHDKECQNCGHTVNEIHCPHCGQKNTETRQSFGHLVGHFVEDLTHYDSAFWKTIKYLLFRPAFLTKEYLMGKRLRYVPPVKLYIFISFVTFLLFAVLPVHTKIELELEHTDAIESIFEKKTHEFNKKENVYIKSNMIIGGNIWMDKPISYSSESQMDSIEQLKLPQYRLNNFERMLAKKLIHTYDHNNPLEVGKKFEEAFFHNLPKIIFIYMPVFAFWLWMFHGKKRWYFFDHCIFTLHYFSFLLLNMLFLIILNSLLSFTSSIETGATILTIVYICQIIWEMLYFYKARRNMYGEKRSICFTKSTLLFFINLISVMLLMVLSAYITIYNLH